MKGSFMNILIIAVVLQLSFGCGTSSGPEYAGRDDDRTIINVPEAFDPADEMATNANTQPIMVDTLLNNTIVNIYDKHVEDSIITVTFDYTPEGGPTRSRILKMHEWLTGVMLFDSGGELLMGYNFESVDQDRGEFFFSLNENQFGYSAPLYIDSLIRMEMGYNGDYTSIEYANQGEFETAINLYEQIHDHGLDPELLDDDQRQMLEHLEEFNIWPSEDDDIAIDDVETTYQLFIDDQFQMKLGLGYSQDNAVANMPGWLKAICDFFRGLSKISPIFGSAIDTTVKIVVLVCNLVESLLD